MGKYLKSYKKYPPGTLVVIKKQSLWQRFKNWITRKEKKFDNLYVLPTYAGISVSKVQLLLNDYLLFIPTKEYSKKELSKFNKIYPSCESIKDYLTMIEIIRPGTIEVDSPLEQFLSNKNYKLIYLDTEPFQDISHAHK